MLNDDCMMCIISYLTVEERIIIERGNIATANVIRMAHLKLIVVIRELSACTAVRHTSLVYQITPMWVQKTKLT